MQEVESQFFQQLHQRHGRENKLQLLPKLKEYLKFSEQYLERLINSKVVIKDKEGKIMKIIGYNQRLSDEIEGVNNSPSL